MICALVGALIEVILAFVHPATIRLSFSTTNTLDNIAGVFVILVSLLGIAGLIRSGAAGKGALGKIGLASPC